MGNILSGRRAQGREGQPQGAEEHRRAPRRQRPGHQEPGHLGVAARPRPPQPCANGVCRYHARVVCPRGHMCPLVHGIENEAALVEPGRNNFQHHLDERRGTVPVQPARNVPRLPDLWTQAQDEQPRVGPQRYRNIRGRSSGVPESRRRLIPRDVEEHLFPEAPAQSVPRPREPAEGPCWAWAMGCCDVGKNCRLSHKKNAKPGDTQKATTV